MSEKPDKRGSLSVSLSRTVESFAQRIGRELEELGQLNESEEKLQREREARLSAMLSKIGTDLEEATSIPLGERFSLTLQRLQRNGWPASRLNLTDAYIQKDLIHSFEVSASAEREAGRICFGEISSPGESILLENDDAVARAELRIRRGLRIFFDKVRAYMMDPRRKEESLAFRNAETILTVLEADERLLESADVFSEDIVSHEPNTVEIDGDADPLEVSLERDRH